MNPERALDSGRAVLAIAEDRNDESLVVRSLAVCALCAIELTEYALVEEYLNRAYPIAERLGDKRLLVDIMNSQARLLSHTSGREVGIRRFEEALALVRDDPEFEDFAMILLINMGVNRARAGEYRPAMNDYLLASEYAERSGNIDHKAHALGNIGAVYRYLRDYPRALHHQTEALELFRSVGDRVSEVHLLGGIGYTHLEHEHFDEAMESFRRQLALARELSISESEASALCGIGNTLELQGELQEALRFDLQALERGREAGNRIKVAELNCYVASLYLKLDDPRTALPYLLETLTLTEERNEPRIRSKVSELLSRAYDRLEDAAAAYRHYREHVAIQNDLHGYAKQQEIAELRAEYESRMAEQERELLRLRAERLERDNEHKARELSLLATNLGQKREALEKIAVELRSFVSGRRNPRRFARGLLMKAEDMLNNEQDWNAFERQFEQTHGDFIRRLIERFPSLTPTELKVCSLLKVNCSTKDIARILCISANTVDWHRRSIRRKLMLPGDVNLTTFLAGF